MVQRAVVLIRVDLADSDSGRALCLNPGRSWMKRSAKTVFDGFMSNFLVFEFGQILFKNGGLRLKRDITEYGEFVRSFNAPTVDEKFELLGSLANVFIVAPESLSTLFEGTPSIRKDAQSSLFSLETTTRAQSWQLDSARCGPALVNERVT
ncbi:Exocyst complex component 5 [Orobanche gracilis]